MMAVPPELTSKVGVPEKVTGPVIDIALLAVVKLPPIATAGPLIPMGPRIALVVVIAPVILAEPK
jgi:hypothetical protein